MLDLSETISDWIRTTAFPLQQRRWYPTARGSLKELKRYEFAPPNEIEDRQWSMLVSTLRHAGKTVPYYRDLFRQLHVDIGTLSIGDFSTLPVLTKRDLRNRAHDLRSEAAHPEADLRASGGSTGTPVQFWQDPVYRDWGRASRWLVEGWWGIEPGERAACIWGADQDLNERSFRDRIHAAISQERICNAFAISEEELERFARMLSRWQPKLLRGYASALAAFAEFMESRPSIVVRPVAIESAAEVLRAQDRSRLERVFGCPVYDFYGSREINNLAAECATHEGLHVNQLTRYLEIVDENGKASPPGQPGRILVTDLTNQTMPLIRYELEDIGTWASSPCSCGRPFPLLESINGRKSDFVICPDGKAIHGEHFTHMFYDLPQVERFQLLQDDVSHVRVIVVTEIADDESLLKELERRTQEVLGTEVALDIIRVDEIPCSPSGKFRFTVSTVPAPWSKQSTERTVDRELASWSDDD